MSVSHGMNVEEVRNLGNLLQRKAAEITDLVNLVESAVVGTTWVGPDATTFKQDWWPTHKANLATIAEQINGFGQSALNNAMEQEQVSGR